MKRVVLALVLVAVMLVGCTEAPAESAPQVTPGDEVYSDITYVDDQGIPEIPEGFGIYGSTVEFDGVWPGWSGTVPLTIVNGQDRDRLFVISLRSPVIRESLLGSSEEFQVFGGPIERFEASSWGFDWGLTSEYGEQWVQENPNYGVIPTDPETGEKLEAVSWTFRYQISGLTAATTYHYRAKILLASGWVYGPGKTFTTTIYEPFPEEYFYWITISEPEFTTLAGETYQIPVTLEMPEDSTYLGKKAEVRILIEDTTQTGLVQIALETKWFIITAD